MWDGVPWFTEGGALHSSEVARLLAYVAFGGAEGIVGAKNLQVKALSSPAAAVQVMPGACAVRNRAPGSSYQAYAARLPVADEVEIAATGATARTDLVIARVENPYSAGETWPLPADVEAGPYIHTRVISGVPSTTTSVRQVRPNDSAITLARINLPANTSSVTQSMITDLRTMAMPRRERVTRYLRGTWDTPDSVGNIKYPDWEWWPNGAAWDLDVPEWATKVYIKVDFAQVDHINAQDAYGRLRVRLGATDSIYTPETRFNIDWVGTQQRHTLVAGGLISVPSSMRGTVQELMLMGCGDSSTGGLLEADAGSAVFVDVEWLEAPTEDGDL